MEAFTIAKVSAAARKAYLQSRPGFSPDNFIPCRDGYKMCGWESQIAFARAMGRGAASGKGKEPHRFDKKREGE